MARKTPIILIKCWDQIWNAPANRFKIFKTCLQFVKPDTWCYFTPVRIAHMFLECSSFCWKDCKQKDTFLHCWWDCHPSVLLAEDIATYLQHHWILFTLFTGILSFILLAQFWNCRTKVCYYNNTINNSAASNRDAMENRVSAYGNTTV